jgi:hypothetical protein
MLSSSATQSEHLDSVNHPASWTIATVALVILALAYGGPVLSAGRAIAEDFVARAILTEQHADIRRGNMPDVIPFIPGVVAPDLEKFHE